MSEAPKNGPAIAENADRMEQIERLRNFRGRLPAIFKFDRDAANARQLATE